jgi:glycosyltransferase involved in cell wall biosynthesis
MSNLVSILIPAYNASRWLGESVNSALAQTWPNKEVVIVDDGSKDDTLAVAQAFHHANVKVATQPNSGAPSARNHALSLAQGDYIQWLDADDVLHPDKISHQMARAEDGQTSRRLLTSAWGKFFFRTGRASFCPDELWQDHAPLDWIVTKFTRHVWMNPAVWLVSRRLTELAGPWDPRVAASGDDDGEYICRVVAASDRVSFVADARCFYRIGIVGSLSWTKENDTSVLESLLLSLHLSVQTLLAIEDSERTRRAAVSHLRNFAPHFYATEAGYLERLQAMATRLGGKLEPAAVSWKYYPFERLFGPSVAKNVMRNWRAAKLLMRRRADWYLYRAGI